MMKRETCKLLVLGAGPGGYVCAIRAAQLGIDTIVVEEKQPGGTCLNVGCIPSKALIHAADEFAKAQSFAMGSALGITAGAPRIDLEKTIDWKDGIVSRLTQGVSGLLKKAGVRYVQGRATVLDGKSVEVSTPDGLLNIRTENLVLATGSRPLELPFLPFGDQIISSTGALSLNAVPNTLCVVGGGYIGLEIGMAMAKLGSQVSVVEATGRLLPQFDAALTQPLNGRLKELGVVVHLNTQARGLVANGQSILVETDGITSELPADKILIAVGRQPVVDGFGLEDLDLEMMGDFIAIDDRCATAMRGVYAIGDITGDPMLAHRAMAQGTVVAEQIAGHPTRWDKRAIASVCFTDPEIVSVGAMPGDIAGTKSSSFPFAANGRSLTIERDDGFVRVVYDPANELVHGIQAVGAGVSELAGEFSLALEMAATLRDVADTVHAHPTLGETVQEVSLLGLGQAVHL